MFGWLDWEKLKREWKTAALTVAALIVESYDALVAFGFINASALKPLFIPEPYQSLFGPAVLISILLLRKWKDSNVR